MEHLQNRGKTPVKVLQRKKINIPATHVTGNHPHIHPLASSSKESQSRNHQRIPGRHQAAAHSKRHNTSHHKIRASSLITKGKLNINNRHKRFTQEKSRQPFTIDKMRILKHRLREWNTSTEQQLLIWTVSTLAFCGAFRINELLSKHESTFDPAYTLLTEDIQLCTVTVEGIRQEAVQVLVKAPKESRHGKAVVIDVYQATGHICPVKAFKKWVATASHREPGQPAFRQADGTPLTGKKVNKILKERLSGFVNMSLGPLTTHCFRIGLASMLGQLGHDDGEIQAVGRWSSRAFETYIKLPRTKRMAMAKKIAMICHWNSNTRKWQNCHTAILTVIFSIYLDRVFLIRYFQLLKMLILFFVFAVQ